MSSKRDAEEHATQPPNLSIHHNQDAKVLPDLEPIPLQLLEYPVIPDSDSLPVLVQFDDTQNSADKDDHEHWDVVPEWRPKLRRAKSNVRRLSIFPNSGVSPREGQLQPPDPQRAASSTNQEEEDLFGLNSRRRSSLQKRLRRRRTCVFSQPSDLCLMETRTPGQQLKEDPDTWSMIANGSNTSDQCMAGGCTICNDDNKVKGADGPAKRLRRVVTEGNLRRPLSQQRRASLGLWKDKPTLVGCPKAPPAEPTTTHVNVFVSAGIPARSIDIPSWIAEVEKYRSMFEVEAGKGVEFEMEEPRVPHPEAVEHDQGVSQVTWDDVERRYSVIDLDSETECSSQTSSQDSAPHTSRATDLDRMNHNMSSWVWRGEPPDQSQEVRDKVSYVNERPEFHLFSRKPQTYFDIRFEHIEDGEATPRPETASTGNWTLEDTSAIITPRAETASGFNWRSQDLVVTTPPADGPRDHHRSIPRQNIYVHPISTLAEQQEPGMETLPVPPSPLRNRTLSNLTSSATHFREHRDSIDIARQRILELGSKTPEVVIHRDSVALAKRRMKNRRQRIAMAADVAPGAQVTSGRVGDGETMEDGAK